MQRSSSDFEDYLERQTGWVVLLPIAFIEFLVITAYVYQIGTKPIGFDGVIIMTLASIIVVALFYSMNIRVTLSHVVVSFGVGLIRKAIALSRVKSIEIVKNPWYYGLGIRAIPNGMLWNIKRSQAIELRFNDSERILRVGTGDPVNLKREIEKRINRSGS